MDARFSEGDTNAFPDLEIPSDKGQCSPLVYLRFWARKRRPKELKKQFTEYVVVGDLKKLLGRELEVDDLNLFRWAAQQVLAGDVIGHDRNAFIDRRPGWDGKLNFYCEVQTLENPEAGTEEVSRFIFRFRYIGVATPLVVPPSRCGSCEDVIPWGQ